ncbi:Outer membrane protein beta-barrel domain-containing protein [Flavobacterium gelidilacus]
MKAFKLLFNIILFSFLTTNAQITKGNWMVGGNGNFSSYESKYKNNGNDITNKGIGINISPKIGYFFANKFAAGTNMSIGYTKPKDFESSIGFGFGPFVRYYFLKEDNQVNLLAEANYIFGNTKSGDNKSKSNGYGFKVGPVIYFNSSVGLEMTLDYNSSKLIPNGSESSTYNNFQIGLGFQIHLEK